ncbi:hypothetical protein F5X96DRAFT_479568 [Biscogniauxia mediterranea]|nr:hypothetical protein F5X96DRAFT_479568 [Biscogniauxia mediterranea]
MMTTQATANKILPEIVLAAFPSPEPDSQRGRKRRRSPQDALAVTATQLPSGESATFRGRCRNRSTSRFDISRNTSRQRGSSLSPTRRKLLRVARLNRHRSQSPSRSRSPNTQDTPKRRRQRTRSRSRSHKGESKNSSETINSSFLRHEIVIRGERSSPEAKQED